MVEWPDDTLPRQLVVHSSGKLLGFFFDGEKRESTLVSIDGGNKTTVLARGIPGQVQTHTVSESGGVVYAIQRSFTANNGTGATAVLRLAEAGAEAEAGAPTGLADPWHFTLFPLADTFNAGFSEMKSFA
jgi:hypothetical protein